MKFTWMLAALVLVTGAPCAGAYDLSESELQGVSDQTAGFHNPTQLSTIDDIRLIPGGYEIDVTFRIGNGGCDPLFGCTAGQPYADFARVSTSSFFNSLPESQRTPFHNFTGFTATVESNVDNVFVQPFIQTAPDWTFYEQADGGDAIAANTPTSVGLLFDDAQNFSGILPANEVHLDSGGKRLANALGFQFVYEGALTFQGDLTDGVGSYLDEEGVSSVTATIRVTGTGVPEPSTALLATLCLAGLASHRR